MDLYDRPAANDFLSSRNDVMTVYRDLEGDEGRLFPLRYVRAGYESDLPTIMVVPGGPGTASVFPYEGLRRRMVSKGLDVIMMEHRGVGMSRTDARGVDLPQSVMSVRNVLDDMLAVLDHAGVRSVVLYGASYGGYLVQRFALEHPERVAALVLDSPFTSTHDESASKELLRAMYLEGKFERTESVARAVRRLLDERIVPVEETGPVFSAVHNYGGVGAVRDLVDLLVQGRGQLAWASIHQLVQSREWFNTTPYVYENDIVGRIAATELGFGSRADHGPLDPLSIEAHRAMRFAPFEGETFHLEAERARITAPTLVVSGERDTVIPGWRSAQAAREIPGAQGARGPRHLHVPGVGHSMLDVHVEMAVICAHWGAAGAMDELITRDVRSVRASAVTEAFGRGIHAALLAEKYSPLKLWSARSLASGRYSSADARGGRRLLSVR